MTRNDENWVEAIGKPTYGAIVDMVHALQRAQTDKEREIAETTIHQDPLCVEVRTGWYAPGDTDIKPSEYNILLGTGGPATRIIGDLNTYGEPETARLEVQDWCKPWIEYTDVNPDILLTYAQQFIFGE